MPELSEIKMVLIVGLHAVMTTLATGDVKKALLASLAVGGCYLIIVATVWLGERMFGTNDSKKGNSEKSSDHDKEEESKKEKE